MKKIKPCPFCGEFPKLYENRSEPAFTVECVNQMCRLQVKSYARETEEAAIELWNTRAEEPTVRTAHWDIDCGSYTPFCSNCGEEPPAYEMTAYCPHCGCKMVTRERDDYEGN